MSRQPLDLKQLPRPVRQRYAVCAVKECGREPRAFSRFCSIHARAFYLTRDPNGRAVRLSEIKPYLNLAEEHLRKYATHPAVMAAEEFLRASLTDQSQPGAVRKQLLRLRVDGAEPRAMLAMFLGMWGLGYYLPYTVATDQCWAFQLGNRVLRVAPMPSITSATTGKRQPVRLPARVAEAYGEHLRTHLGVFANQFWEHIRRELEAPARAAHAIALAVRQTPFGVPSEQQPNPSRNEKRTDHPEGLPQVDNL